MGFQYAFGPFLLRPFYKKSLHVDLIGTLHFTIGYSGFHAQS